jgi:hypothetical protein
MRCPSCGSNTSIGSGSCQICGFVVAALADRLGQDAVSMERVIDAAHCLRLRDRTRLDAALDDFEKRFPQIICCCYFGVLPATVNCAEAAVWMVENGVRPREGKLVGGSAAIVLVVDPSAHCLGVAIGASLAAFLPQSHIERWIGQNQYHFWHGEHVEGLMAILAEIGKTFIGAGEARRRSVTAKPMPRLGLARAKPSPSPKAQPSEVEQL